MLRLAVRRRGGRGRNPPNGSSVVRPDPGSERPLREPDPGGVWGAVHDPGDGEGGRRGDDGGAVYLMAPGAPKTQPMDTPGAACPAILSGRCTSTPFEARPFGLGAP